MRSVPRVQGPDTAVVRVSLQEASLAQQDGDQVRLSRAWKLFSLWPRMLLWRPPRGGLVPERPREGRLSLSVAGRQSCGNKARSVEAAAVVAFARKRGREGSEEDLGRRTAQAQLTSCVHADWCHALWHSSSRRMPKKRRCRASVHWNLAQGASVWHTFSSHKLTFTTTPRWCQWMWLGLTTSRNSMLSGSMGVRELPFARLFNGDPSTYLWEDEVGDVHHIHQGEGGEQGDGSAACHRRQTFARREVVRIPGRSVRCVST